MNTIDRILVTAMAVFYGLFMFAIGWAAAQDHYDGICVPGNAVNYSGILGAWLDRDGAVVLMAEEEDTYGWCTKP